MSGIDNAKQAMGWLKPTDRAACCNCSLVKFENLRSGRDTAPAWRCSPGGFLTPRFAICDKYVPMAPTGSVPT